MKLHCRGYSSGFSATFSCAVKNYLTCHFTHVILLPDAGDGTHHKKRRVIKYGGGRHPSKKTEQPENSFALSTRAETCSSRLTREGLADWSKPDGPDMLREMKIQ